MGLYWAFFEAILGLHWDSYHSAWCNYKRLGNRVNTTSASQSTLCLDQCWQVAIRYPNTRRRNPKPKARIKGMKGCKPEVAGGGIWDVSLPSYSWIKPRETVLLASARFHRLVWGQCLKKVVLLWMLDIMPHMMGNKGFVHVHRNLSNGCTEPCQNQIQHYPSLF